MNESKLVKIDKTLKQYFSFPATKVYAALGNHDYHPKSQLPPGQNYIYNQTAEMWKQWLDPESQSLFKIGMVHL